MDDKFLEKLNLINKKYELLLSKYPKDNYKEIMFMIGRVTSEVNLRNNNTLNREINNLSNKSKEIMNLLKEYKKDIKNLYINSNKALIHINSLSKEELDYKLKCGVNKKLINSEEIGTFLLANDFDNYYKHPYLLKDHDNNIVKIDEDTYLYLHDNLKILDNKLLLKNKNYVYYLNPKYFEPVVSIRMKTEGGASFHLTNQWKSTNELDINNKDEVYNIDEVLDVSESLNYLQVFYQDNDYNIDKDLKTCISKDEKIDKLKDALNNKTVNYLNKDLGINQKYYKEKVRVKKK